jgi:ribosomal protein L29
MKFTSTANKLSEGELTTQARELRAKIAKLRLERFVGKSRNVREVFTLRKHLSIINTLLNNKNINKA